MNLEQRDIANNRESIADAKRVIDALTDALGEAVDTMREMKDAIDDVAGKLDDDDFPCRPAADHIDRRLDRLSARLNDIRWGDLEEAMD